MQHSPNPQPLSGMVVPRFGEIASFMRLPIERDPEKLDIALVGVPFDGGTTHRPGERPVGLVHFDAHSDTADSYFGGERYTHGTPFRRAIEEGLIDPKRLIQIGVRGSVYSADEKEWATGVGVRIVHIEEFFRLGPDAVVAEARRIVGDGPTYLTFDVDGLDPVYAPGTGTPEIGGFSTAEAQRRIRPLAGLDLVGGDVVEVAPPFDPSGNTALVGATMMFEILCVLAPAVHRRKNRMRRL